MYLELAEKLARNFSKEGGSTEGIINAKIINRRYTDLMSIVI